MYYWAMMRYGRAITPEDVGRLVELLKRVRALNPAFAPAHIELSRAYLKLGQLENADAAAMRAAQLEPGRAGYHTYWALVKLARGDAANAARLARYVAERWYGTDRDQALEVWNAVAKSDAKAAVPALEVKSDAPEGLQVEGDIVSVKCEEKRPFDMELKNGERVLHLSPEEGKSFMVGFEDTIWYGSDHFSLCHHLIGRKAVVVYADSGTGKGAVKQIRVKDEMSEEGTAGK
jgi:tetratricopeptide (TPR) repeat protein